MSMCSQFHKFLILGVIAAFGMPIFLFILLVKISVSPLLACLVSLFLFCYLMGFICFKILVRYSTKSVKKLE